MAEATKLDLEGAIRHAIAHPENEPWHATNVLLYVEQNHNVDVSSLQTVFFRMLGDGVITLGPGFIPELVD
jgi:hypothetical protein